MEEPYSGSPDFINERGVKWWLDKSLTRYAERADHNGTKLEAKVFYVERPDGHKTRILIDKDGPIHADQSLESMAFHIDALKIMASKRTGESP